MIITKNLSLAYSGENILEDLNFTLSGEKKIGIIGRNGVGKTSLIRLIVGEEEPTEGKIEFENEVIAYVPQVFDFPKELVGEYLEKKLENSWDFYLVEKLVKDLEFNNFNVYQEISTLSQGQKMKLKLIETMLLEPTTIFIDEPTNHLDIEGIMWFERYVKRLSIKVIMISHDRSFLNNTVDEIWEIENKKIIVYVGDYDFYKQEKLRLIDSWDREYKLFLQKKAQLERLIENARKIKDGKSRSKAVSSAKKRYDREVERDKKEQYVSKKIGGVNFETDVRGKKLMLRFTNVSKNYAKTKVFDDLDFELRGNEKVWLYGPNGAGKSTLVKIIMGEEKISKGELYVGENIKIGYFAQEQAHLDFEKSVLDVFIAETGSYYNEAFGKLKKFLFEKDSVKKRVKHLSPGERARFAFAIFANKNYDLLILDEPTNHLDIEAKEVIEQSLADYKGTLLLVSHDRYFVESVGINKVLNLKDSKLTLVS